MNTKTLFDLSIISELYMGYFIDEYMWVWSNKHNIPRRLVPLRSGWMLYYNGKQNYHNRKELTSRIQSHEGFKTWLSTNKTLNTNGDITPSNGFIVTPLSGVVDLSAITVYNTEMEARQICEQLGNERSEFVRNRIRTRPILTWN